jgi:hypothetical protein
MKRLTSRFRPDMISVRFSASTLLIAIASFVVAACSDSTEPKLPAPSYDLVSYEGQTLPVETRALIVIPAEPGGVGYRCSDRLTAMNLHFATDGSFTQTESRLLICDDGRPDAPSTVVTQGSYELRGATLTLTVDLGGGSSSRSSARFSDTSLTIYHRELSLNGFGTTMTDAPLVFAAS